MAGGYDNEDRQAELEELRREKEREARERLEGLRRQGEAGKAAGTGQVAEGATSPRGESRPDGRRESAKQANLAGPSSRDER